MANIVDIISTDAALRSSSTRDLSGNISKEDRLELKHPSDSEKNSGVIWDERSTRKDLVTTGSIKVQKSFAYGIST
jgi:hypothetical protein